MRRESFQLWFGFRATARHYLTHFLFWVVLITLVSGVSMCAGSAAHKDYKTRAARK